MRESSETLVKDAAEGAIRQKCRVARDRMASLKLRKYRDGDEQAVVEMPSTALGAEYTLEYWTLK